MNKKFKRSAWLWVVLCLPMVFMVYFFITFSGNNIKAEDVSAVTVLTPDESGSYTFEGKGDINFYLDLYLDADRISAPVRDVAEEEPMVVSIVREGNTSVFELYPEVNTNGCFFKNSKGEYYALMSSHAKTLLQREECIYVYANAGYSLPRLTFVTGGIEDTILPMDYSWQYKDIGGNAVDDGSVPKAEGQQSFSYYSNEGCAFRFSTQPESYSIAFFDENGVALSVTDPAALLFTTDTRLKAKIEASWAQNDKVMGGRASYEFDLLYDVLPKLTHSSDKAVIGDIITVAFRHLSEDEEIRLETQLVTGEIELIYEEDYAFVVIPVSLENTAGEYALKFYAGDINDTFTLTVTTPEDTVVMATVDTELYTTFRGKEYEDKRSEFLNSLEASKGDKMISRANPFGKPVSSEVLYDFGTYMSVNGVPPVFYLESIDYKVGEDTSIKATERGVIVYMGSDEIYGNTVIIDHGYGVKSHYYNIGMLNEYKAVGDTVEEGEILGTGGVSGMVYKDGETEIPTFRFAVSINGVFVNPNILFESGLDF